VIDHAIKERRRHGPHAGVPPVLILDTGHDFVFGRIHIPS
jgi:hypothetical protein